MGSQPDARTIHIEWGAFVALVKEGVISEPTYMPESDEPTGRRRWALVGYDRHRSIIYTLITARKEIRVWKDLGAAAETLFDACGQMPSIQVLRSPNALYVHSDGKPKLKHK
jgi:hypothetical protein